MPHTSTIEMVVCMSTPTQELTTIYEWEVCQHKSYKVDIVSTHIYIYKELMWGTPSFLRLLHGGVPTPSGSLGSRTIRFFRVLDLISRIIVKNKHALQLRNGGSMAVKKEAK